MTTMNYRIPDTQRAADCQRQADRYERQGMPRNANDYRAEAAASELLATRIAAVLSVEMGES